MTTNEKIASDFAAAFNPPLMIARTERVNGVRFPDAWQVTFWNNAKSIGITAVIYEGQIHAYLEAAGRGEIASMAGRAFHRALECIATPVEENDGGA